MANDGLITEIASKKVFDDLQRIDEALESVYNHINKVNSVKVNTPSGIAGSATASSAQIQQLARVREQSNKVIERERLAEIRLQQAREKAFANYDKQLSREQAKLATAQSLQAKTARQIKLLDTAYTELATKKARYNNLTDNEEKRLITLTSTLQKYRTIQDGVNVTVGKYQQRVGQYERGNSALGNSFQQILREAPAAAVSLNTFFLAISNNLPVFFDAISNTSKEITRLRQAGEQVPSLFSQLSRSIFSVGTALTVGVTLLTFFGEEIVELGTKLFTGKKAIDALKESTESLNSIRIESEKSIVDERIALESNLAIARDTTLSLKEREIAANNVLKQYPFWFENLGKEAILNGNVAEAVRGVNEALLARAKANAAVTKITENQSKIIDAEEEILAIQEKIASAENRARVARIRGRAASGAERGYEQEAAALADIASYNEDIADLRKDISALNEINNRLTGYSIEQAKEAIGLDYQSVEAKKMKLEQEVDYQASMFELQKAELQRQVNYYKSTMENVENSYADREDAAKNLNTVLNQLAELQLNESIRLAERETLERKRELLQQAKDGEISYANANAVIQSLETDALYKRKLAYENFSQEVESNNNQIAESFKDVFKTISEQEQNFRLGQKTLDNLRQLKLFLEGAKGYTTPQQFEKLEEKIEEIADLEREMNIERLRNEKALVISEIERIGNLEKNTQNNQAINSLKNQQLELDKRITESEKEQLEITIRKKYEAAKLRETYYSTFKDLGQFGLSSLNQFFDGSFAKLLRGTKLIEDANIRSREQFKITFLALTEVAQQAYAFFQQNTEAAYQSMYAQLETQKRVADSFAINEAGKAEIERQYEEKRREIRRKELQAQKEQAIFNAVINTAQAVTAALPNFLLAGIVAGFGAAQVALIAARDIPAYAEGTDNHKGGLAIVGDGGKRELIWQPSIGYSVSPNTDTLVNLEKGSKVFPDLTKTGLISNGLPTVNNVGGQQLTEGQMTRAMRKAVKGMSKAEISITKNGVRTHIITEQGKLKKMNNSANFKGTIL